MPNIAASKNVPYQAKLTTKQALFVREYVKDFNAARAAVRSGYSEKTAKEIGAENLQKPYLADAITKLLDKRSKKLDMKAQEVIDGLREIAENRTENIFARMRAYELIGKHLGMFREIHEHRGSIRHNVALDALSVEELRKLIDQPRLPIIDVTPTTDTTTES